MENIYFFGKYGGFICYKAKNLRAAIKIFLQSNCEDDCDCIVKYDALSKDWTLMSNAKDLIKQWKEQR